MCVLYDYNHLEIISKMSNFVGTNHCKTQNYEAAFVQTGKSDDVLWV